MKEVLIVFAVILILWIISLPFAAFSQSVCTTVNNVVICSGEAPPQPRCFVLSDYTVICT